MREREDTPLLLETTPGKMLARKAIPLRLCVWKKVHFTQIQREKERKRENRRERKEFNFISFIFLQYIALLYILPLTEYHGK